MNRIFPTFRFRPSTVEAVLVTIHLVHLMKMRATRERTFAVNHNRNLLGLLIFDDVRAKGAGDYVSSVSLIHGDLEAILETDICDQVLTDIMPSLVDLVPRNRLATIEGVKWGFPSGFAELTPLVRLLFPLVEVPSARDEVKETFHCPGKLAV